MLCLSSCRDVSRNGLTTSLTQRVDRPEIPLTPATEQQIVDMVYEFDFAIERANSQLSKIEKLNVQGPACRK